MEFIVYIEIENNITKSGNIKEKKYDLKRNKQSMPVLVRLILRQEGRFTDFHSVGKAWLVVDRRNSVIPAGSPVDPYLSHLGSE